MINNKIVVEPMTARDLSFEWSNPAGLVSPNDRYGILLVDDLTDMLELRQLGIYPERIKQSITPFISAEPLYTRRYGVELVVYPAGRSGQYKSISETKFTIVRRPEESKYAFYYW